MAEGAGGEAAVDVGEAVLVGEVADGDGPAGPAGDVGIGGERDDGAADEARRLRRAEVEDCRGADPAAAPTSMRSVRTKPGQSDTTDTPCGAELVRGVGGDAVERALAHAVRDLPRVLLRARRADVDDEAGVRRRPSRRAANTLAT